MKRARNDEAEPSRPAKRLGLNGPTVQSQLTSPANQIESALKAALGRYFKISLVVAEVFG